ncbi:MAG: TIGR00730 family Rossman fold protein [Betaproteobacteria bacterium]|jgi:uncharacterized protein (TIGR00730 family)|nr:TIGR00730 family Rossman fold protein [Betaproteobacteria bacterium]MBP7779950.1 TIGR00730 family Rossman fold protein [Burkholderiaceae bacterium]
MESTMNLSDGRLADAWATLQAHGASAKALTPDTQRLAFADPEFMLRRETRGIRFQLELLKPDLEQQALGVENTVVVFGSARYRSELDAKALLEQAIANGYEADIDEAKILVRNSIYYEKAREFGRIVARYSAEKEAKDKLFVCTGGGPGIMEAANRGAFEAGGQSVGLSIALPKEEKPNPYVTPELCFRFHYFALRKMHFMMRASALVAFPGGFGTLDELFETLTLVQCKKAKPVPIVLFGSNYWRRLFNPQVLVEEGAISAKDLNLFQYVDTPEAAWAAIEAFYQL